MGTPKTVFVSRFLRAENIVLNCRCRFNFPVCVRDMIPPQVVAFTVVLLVASAKTVDKLTMIIITKIPICFALQVLSVYNEYPLLMFDSEV